MVQVVDPSKIIHLEDRSGAETDDTCGMMYWFNRLQGGKGIVPVKEQFHYAIGRQTHEDLATVAEMEDISPDGIQAAIDPILGNISTDDQLVKRNMELLYRRLGWLAAFALYIEPVIRDRFEDIGIEKELILDRDPLFVPCQPDRVLRNKRNGVIHYLEFKTTASASYKWQNSWPLAIQLHIGLAAIQEELEEKVGFGQIMGLMKGYEDDDRRLRHPYVWGYYNHRDDKWSAEYRSGMDWIPMPVWEYPGGIVKWVQFCGEDIAKSQFPHSPPVFLNERLLADWVQRRLRRQRQIRIVKDSCQMDLARRAMYFERRTKNCRPPYGESCPYLLCCHNAQAELDPMATGEYTVRTPHHDIDTEDLR